MNNFKTNVNIDGCRRRMKQNEKLNAFIIIIIIFSSSSVAQRKIHFYTVDSPKPIGNKDIIDVTRTRFGDGFAT